MVWAWVPGGLLGGRPGDFPRPAAGAEDRGGVAGQSSGRCEQRGLLLLLLHFGEEGEGVRSRDMGLMLR